jgi:hypothetical protein
LGRGLPFINSASYALAGDTGMFSFDDVQEGVSSAVTLPGSVNHTTIIAAKMIKAIVSSMCVTAC